MQTLIKWPGGKTSEFEIIKKFLPNSYVRYVEPFFGGGAVFFNLHPQTSIINDISSNLMQFYSYIKADSAVFKKYLYTIDREWEFIKEKARLFALKLRQDFYLYREDVGYKFELERKIFQACSDLVKTFDGDICSDTLIDTQKLLSEMVRMTRDKILRTRRNELKNGCLSDEDLLKNIVTGFTSGYYMYMRSLLNDIEKSRSYVADEYKIAIFYFVREFCYGSMFRYNKYGEFNIPYGGIGYNNKDFKKKIDALFSKDTIKYFENTDVRCSDFENILDEVGKDDFVFLDPPYDSDFSEYENRSFQESDQRRLSARLHETKAKFLLIIKNTPLINELYQNNGYKIYAFDNKYSYCVKGRNDRNAVHLIIINYDVDNDF